MRLSWFRSGLVLQIPTTFAGPKLDAEEGTRNGGYDERNPSHNLSLAPNDKKLPNVYRTMKCEWDQFGSISNCPASLRAGFNWADLHNETESHFPVIFFGGDKSYRDLPLRARSIKGCMHPSDARTPSKGRYAGGCCPGLSTYILTVYNTLTNKKSRV